MQHLGLCGEQLVSSDPRPRPLGATEVLLPSALQSVGVHDSQPGPRGGIEHPPRKIHELFQPPLHLRRERVAQYVPGRGVRPEVDDGDVLNLTDLDLDNTVAAKGIGVRELITTDQRQRV